jgi:hypothetical protein
MYFVNGYNMINKKDRAHKGIIATDKKVRIILDINSKNIIRKTASFLDTDPFAIGLFLVLRTFLSKSIST